MQQTSTRTSTPPSPPRPPAPGQGTTSAELAARSAGRLIGAVRRSLSVRSGGTPTRMRLLMIVTILLGIVLSLGGWFAVDRRASSIDDAASAADQLISVQDVRVVLVQADSLASLAYLVSGAEQPAQRQQYDELISTASTELVAVAARASSANAATLSAVSSKLGTYVGLVEQARANNRQGFPVGSAYQRQARTVAQDMVTQLRTVEQSVRSEVNTSMERGHRASWLLVTSASVVLVALGLGSVWLSRRTRRLVNVPLAAAAVIALVVLVGGVAVSASAIDDADAVVDRPLAAADLLAQGRAAAFDARSNEALTLIARGNGAAYEEQWQLSNSTASIAIDDACSDFSLGCDAQNRLEEYAEAHADIRSLDDDGNWDQAVDDSTSQASDASVSFQAFADLTRSSVASQSGEAAGEFANAGDSLGLLGGLVIAAGLVIAVLAAAGYGQRIREYR